MYILLRSFLLSRAALPTCPPIDNSGMSCSSNDRCGHANSCQFVAKTFFFVSARELVQCLWLQRASCHRKLENGFGELKKWNCADSHDTQGKGQAQSQ